MGRSFRMCLGSCVPLLLACGAPPADEAASPLRFEISFPASLSQGPLDGRLLAFALDELKLEPNGGRGLTLMDVDEASPLVSVASCADSLRVLGSGRGGKPKDEVLRGAALEHHVGRRARKGRRIEGFVKPQRVL